MDRLERKPIFNKSVLKAVVQWKYQPRIVNGVPQDTLLTIESQCGEMNVTVIYKTVVLIR